LFPCSARPDQGKTPHRRRKRFCPARFCAQAASRALSSPSCAVLLRRIFAEQLTLGSHSAVLFTFPPVSGLGRCFGTLGCGITCASAASISVCVTFRLPATGDPDYCTLFTSCIHTQSLLIPTLLLLLRSALTGFKLPDRATTSGLYSPFHFFFSFTVSCAASLLQS
jgi:hypothetical protein